MKKILLVTTAMFLLAGCTQTNNNVPVNEPVSDEATVGKYKNEEFNISFNYPSDWSIGENNTNKSVTVLSTRPDNGSEMTVTIPAQSFDEYEKEMSELIASGKMSVENNSPLEDTTYPSKKYGQEGWVYYLIEINGNYVGVGSEMYLTQDQKEGLKEILNSLSF